MSLNTEVEEPMVKKLKSLQTYNNEAVKQESLELENEDEEAAAQNDHEDDDDDFQFPPDEDITDMLDGVEYHGSFPTITDRYFTPYYKINVQCEADDMRILLHSNRICMLSLAPSHAALQSGRQITKVDFKVSEKLDRTLNKVSGKSKHGAQPLQANSNICIIHCASGEMYTIKCCVIGKLVEVNESLMENPKLLAELPHRGGYLAIVLPNIKLLESIKETLLTQQQYEAAILKRQCDNIEQEPKTSELNNSQSEHKKETPKLDATAKNEMEVAENEIQCVNIKEPKISELSNSQSEHDKEIPKICFPVKNENESS